MPQATFTLETYVLRGRNEREYPVTVDYKIVPGCKATRLTPAEPDSVELTGWRCDVDLTDAELDEIEAEALDHAQEAIADYRADAAEYAAMCRAERLSPAVYGAAR